MAKLQQIVDSAMEAYSSGCNCSEGLTVAFVQHFPQQIPASIVPMSSNFGGGIASGCLCGALAGGTMVIGALAGRQTPDTRPKDEVNALSKEYMELMQTTFAQPCCKEIKQSELGATGDYKNCVRVVGKTAELLAQFLAAKGLIQLEAE